MGRKVPRNINEGLKPKIGQHKNWKPRGIEPTKVAILVQAWLTNGYDKLAALETAGYAWSGSGTAVFKHHQVLAEIERRQKGMEKKFALTEAKVVEGLLRIARGPEIMAKYLKETPQGGLRYDFTGITEEDKACITALHVKEYHKKGVGAVTETEVKQSDPKAAWDSLARHLGMFNDKLKVTGEVSLVDRLLRGRERARLRNITPEPLAIAPPTEE